MFLFLSGRPCLDLTTTLQVRHHATPRETLLTPADVALWSKEAGLADGLAVDAGGLERTRRLREVVHRLCRAVLEGVPFGAADLAALNDAAGVPPLVPRLTAEGTKGHCGDLGQVLSTLARDAIDLLSGPYSERIRECAHSDCSRLFLDASHAGRRRWCGMTSCGNKAKAAAYRRRKSG